MRKRILLVDDTVTVTAIERIFLGDSYEYSEARNGAEAFTRALEEAPDLILMDINMPVADGISGLRTLKSEPRTQHIPVVIVTTRSEREVVEACRALGCSDFLEKPISRTELRATVDKLLGARS
jgi:CheY-like chemotaxis protein